MENNGVQLSLEEQLEQLKKEQEEAKRICDKRIDMGMLYYDSASVQELAAEILERKIKIQELEEQIAQKGSTKSDKTENHDEKALAEYKPKMSIFQWIRSKLNKIRESVKESRKAKMNNLKVEVDSPEDRYQKIMDQNVQEPNPWVLSPEAQKVVEEDFKERSAANNRTEQDLEPGQLTQEDLDKVISYEDGIEPRYDFPKRKPDKNSKVVGR